MNKQQKMEKEYFKLTRKPVSDNETDFTEFTNIVLATMGSYVEDKYPTLKFFIKERDKSYRSFRNKLLQKEEIYDYIGYRIVVEYVPYDFQTGNSKFDIELQELLNKRSEYEERKNEQQAKLANFQKRFAHTTDKELYEFTLNEVQTNLNLLKKQYVLCDDECSLRVSDYLVDELTMNCAPMQMNSICSIEGRHKVHRKDNGYYATHNCIQVADKESKYCGWKAEVQGKSKYREDMSHNGTSAHTERIGKKRVLPPLPETEDDIELFRERIREEVSQYRFYEGKGTVRIASMYENFGHYYEKMLSRNPEYAEEIKSNPDLIDRNHEIKSY